MGPRLEQRWARWPHPTVGVAGILRPGTGMEKVALPCSDVSLGSVVLVWSLLPREASAGGWGSAWCVGVTLLDNYPPWTAA